MHAQQTLTIPTKQPTRTEIFAFRCTAEEREAIFEFAQQLDCPLHRWCGTICCKRQRNMMISK